MRRLGQGTGARHRRPAGSARRGLARPAEREGEARQPGRFSQGQIHAEHAADAVPEFGQGHRLVVVVVGGLVLAGEEHQERRVGRPDGKLTAVGSCETEADPAHPGDVEVAILEHGHRIGHGDLGEPLNLWVRGAGEQDAGHVAHPAAGAVAANEVSGGHPIRPVRPAHVRGHRGVVLAQPDHLLSAADLGAELAGVLAEEALESRLWERQRLHRGIGQLCEVNMHPAEREPGSRPGTGAGCFESLERASVAQHLQDLPAETAGLRDVSDLRMPLEYQRSHSGQAQFTSEHQAGRAGAHDDHVGVHHWPLPSQSFVGSTRDPYAVNNTRISRLPFP